MSKKDAQIMIRVPHETWRMLKRASFNGDISMNKILIEAIEARKKFIEKKYLLNHVDS